MMLRKPLAATAIATLAGLALAGCTPPNQKDSDLKVDTATSVEAPAPATSSAATEAPVETAVAPAEAPAS